MVSEQGRMINELASDVRAATSFNSQIMIILEQMNSRLDNLSGQIKRGPPGTPIIIQAPSHATIIQQPMETSREEDPHKLMDTPTVVATSQCGRTNTDDLWPRIKNVTSQVPHPVHVHALTSVEAPRASEEIMIPRVSSACQTLVIDRVGCSPGLGKNSDTITERATASQSNYTEGSTFTRTPLSRTCVPFTPRMATSTCDKEPRVPIENVNGSGNTLRSFQVNRPVSSCGQCTPSTVCCSCCHRNPRSCQLCLRSKASPHSDFAISRNETPCTPSNDTRIPQINSSSIDIGGGSLTSKDEDTESEGKGVKRE